MTKEFIYKFFKEKFRSLSEALQLQAKEYKRRLRDLNGEAGRLRSMQSEYIPREVFDRTVNELREKLAVLTTWKANQEGKQSRAQWIAIGALAVSILLKFIKF